MQEIQKLFIILKKHLSKTWLVALVFLTIAFLIAGRGLLKGSTFNASDLAFDNISFGGEDLSSNSSLTDSPYIHFPRNFHFWENVKQGDWPTYVGNIGLGVPTTAFPPGQFIGSIPMLIGSTEVGITLTTVFLLTLAGLLMYKLLQYLKVDPRVAFLGGLLWMMNAHQIAWLQFSAHPATEVWIPLLFLVFIRTLRETNVMNSIASLIALFLFLNSGYVQITIYILVALALMTLFFLIKQYREKKSIQSIVRKALVVGGITIIGIATLGSSIINTTNAINTGLRGDSELRQVDDCNICSSDQAIAGILGFVSPDLYGKGPIFGYPGSAGSVVEVSRFFGVIPLLLLLLTPIIKKNKSLIFFSLGTAVLFYLALSDVPPITQLFEAIPYLKLGDFRRMITMVVFPLIVASMLIFDNVIGGNLDISKLSKTTKRLAKKIPYGVPVVLISYFAILFQPFTAGIILNIFGLSRGGEGGLSLISTDIIYSNSFFILGGLSIFAYLFYSIVENNKRLLNAIGLIIIIFTFFDLARFALYFNVFTEEKFVFPNPPAFEYIQQDSENFRIHIAKIYRSSLPSNTNLVYGMEEIGAYTTTLDTDYIDLYFEAFDSAELSSNGKLFAAEKYSEILDMFNVKYVVTQSPPQEFDPLNPEVTIPPRELIEDSEINPNLDLVYIDNFLTVYENKDYLERIFIASSAEVIEDPAERIEKLTDHEFNENKTVILSEDSNYKQTNGRGSVKNIQVFGEALKAEVNMNSEGWVVFSQAYNSHWKLFLDGQETDLQRGNHVLMTALIPEGDHELELRYIDDPLLTFSSLNIVIFGGAFLISAYKFYTTRDKRWLVLISATGIIVVVSLLPIYLSTDVPLRDISRYPWNQ